MIRARRTALSQLALLASLALLAPLGALAPAVSAHAATAPDIPVADAKVHLQKFQEIATANGGSRGTNQPGYKASVDYVAQQLQQAGYQVTVQPFFTWFGNSWNVIAEKAGTVGAAGPVVMFGAHLDSVENGPGINDNGSGSAGILASAIAYARSGATPANNVRFAFWGAEEQGLLGSAAYNRSLSADQRNRIKAYFNFDMIASPNPGYFVYDDNAAGNGMRDFLTGWYDAHGIPWEYVDVQGRSDHASFRAAGLPTSGIYSGAEEIMTAAQAAKWGGQAGKAFDECYHYPCDGISNINDTALDRGADIIAAALWEYAAKNFVPVNLIQNPGFEQGPVAWAASPGVITNAPTKPAKSGSWKALMGGQGKGGTQTVSQTVTIPVGASRPTLQFQSMIHTTELLNWIPWDTLTVTATADGASKSLLTMHNGWASRGYVARQVDLSAYAGKTVTLTFTSRENGGFPTTFAIDDVSVELVP